MSSVSAEYQLIDQHRAAYSYKDQAFTMASFLTDPLCNSHCYFRQISLVNHCYPTASKCELVFKKTLLLLNAAAQGALSIVTSPCGILIRYISIKLQAVPYLYCKGDCDERQCDLHELNILSWNICAALGGYSITDGSVAPWRFRMKLLIERLHSQNVQVLCLYEVFDIQTAHALIEGLKKNFAHFYYHIGPQVIGPSSGLFVASQIKIVDPSFQPFSSEMLAGRAKFSGKGVFSFEISLKNESIKVFTTHLQHSENPSMPNRSELVARKQELQMIVNQMRSMDKSLSVLTGDLNLDEEEYEERFPSVFEKGYYNKKDRTWGGNEFCAKLLKKPISLPSNLDHTLVLKDSNLLVKTTYIPSNFNSQEFNITSLSDHKGLLSTITLKI